MNNFFGDNKNLLTYSLIALFIIPVFGIKIFISLVGNILLLLLLIPLLLRESWVGLRKKASKQASERQ